MKRISPIGAALAGLAITFAPAALAQSQPSQNVPADRVERPETSPSAAQNNPDNGSTDPARIGTATRSNQDMNNHRNPQKPVDKTTVTETTTSPVTTYENTTPPVTVDTTPAQTTVVDTTTPPPANTTYEPAATTERTTLPRTASPVPLVGLAGLSAFGAALTLRARRFLRK